MAQEAGLSWGPVSPRAVTVNDAPDVLALRHAIERDGITALPAAFAREWAEELREDFERAFAEARGREAGTVNRGRHRHYFSVHPETIRGFPDLAGHPTLTALYELMLGSDYKIVELGFDVPLPGALHQPWHRDFPAPPSTSHRRLTSLAVNVTTVDVTEDMGPFEIAPGTHWESGDGFAHGMFPPASATGRYERLATRRQPRQGDVSVRTGLAIHRGTPNVSDRARAVLILGVASRDENTDVHELHVRPDYLAALPPNVRDHLACTVVDELRPIVQRHDIEGLMMGG